MDMNMYMDDKFHIHGKPAPVPVGVCASKPWSISSACKKIEGAADPKGRNLVHQKVHFSGSKLTCSLMLIPVCDGQTADRQTDICALAIPGLPAYRAGNSWARTRDAQLSAGYTANT